jgi:hypothetical protein
MSDARSRFELSSDEVAFLRRLASREPSLERFLSQFRSGSDSKYIVDFERFESEQLRGQLTELLAKVGFNSDYSPNNQGQLLEELIDRFNGAGETRESL